MTTSRRTAWLAAALWAALLAFPVTARAIPDSLITMKVKLALLTTEGVSSTAINVDTLNGQVTLHGKVGSQEEEAKAEAAAKQVGGVQQVRDLLQVVPEEQKAAVARHDSDIKDAVDEALRNHKFRDKTEISVQSVNHGTVLLRGKAETITDKLSAIEIARNQRGVRRVSSEIQGPDTMAQTDTNPRPSEHQGEGFNDSARDAWITSATKMRLLADRRTSALDTNVDTRGGTVTLFGMVSSQEAKFAAEEDARKVSGVKQVINELQVVPKERQQNVKARDEDIERDVKQKLEARNDLKDVNVQVKDCVARLSGTVPSSNERLEAATVARSTDGVCSVEENDLRIRSGDVPNVPPRGSSFPRP